MHQPTRQSSTAAPNSNLCLLPLLLFTLLAAAGCVANRYEAPIGNFRDQTQATISVLGDFYSSRNSYELDLYLQGVAADNSLPVQTVDAHGKPTSLAGTVFSPASIKARLDALVLIGAYADRLNDLATTDAPANFQTSASLLGQNLSSLDVTFKQLQGKSDPTANKYIGPISDLIGTIGQMFLEHKRDELLAKAITDGAPAVDKILSQMRDDMDNIFSLEVISGANERLATLIVAYNSDREKLNFDERTARLAEIKTATAEAAAAADSAPAGLITSMMGTHKALVQFAQAKGKTRINSLAALNRALQQWTTQIQTLAAEVKALIH
jgi:hypothetical protein